MFGVLKFLYKLLLFFFCFFIFLSNASADFSIGIKSDSLNRYRNELSVGFHSFFLGYSLLSKKYPYTPLTFQADFKRGFNFGKIRFGVGGGSIFYPQGIPRQPEGWSHDRLILNLGYEKKVLRIDNIYDLSIAIDAVNSFSWEPILTEYFYGLGFSFVNKFPINSKSSIAVDLGLSYGAAKINLNEGVTRNVVESPSPRFNFYRNLVLSYSYSF